jgi:hypothetical protein
MALGILECCRGTISGRCFWVETEGEAVKDVIQDQHGQMMENMTLQM